MRLEYVRKIVWEPIRRDPMRMNFEVAQILREMLEGKHHGFIETIEYT